jgi:hypothetical protein
VLPRSLYLAISPFHSDQRPGRGLHLCSHPNGRRLH